MAVGQFCRWDWLLDIAELINGVASLETNPMCHHAPQHTVVFKRVIQGGGLTVQLDVDVCDKHEVEAQAADGYLRSIKKHVAKTT